MVAVARRFDGRDLERAAELVDHQRCERFAFDVFGDDEKGSTVFGHLLEQGQQVLQARKLLVADENAGVVELDEHLLAIDPATH